MSGNTIGAHFWSDGKCEAPMNPEHPWLVKCPECSAVFWIDEADSVGEYFFLDDPSQANEAVRPALPSEEDYLGMLSDSLDNPKKELYLRVRAWWAFNDTFRRNVDSTLLTLPERAVANLSALSRLLSTEDPTERIMKAEIARELGEFRECLELLEYVFPENVQGAVESIRTAAQNRERTVKAMN